jgi:oligopeptide transport system substrate-binding protein
LEIRLPGSRSCRAIRVAIYSAALAALLSGCARRETPVEAGIRTRTLLIGNSAEPADLDPHVISLLAEQRLQVALFEGLTAFDQKTALPVPGAAERWETSPDGLTWTFHLRAGLKWSNGEPLVADDFVQSWRRALTPTVACPFAYLFSVVKNADAFSAGQLADPTQLGFVAPDVRTVVITLAQPTPTLPLYTALPCWHPINPRVLARFNALDRRGAAWTKPGNFVGNGPFTLAEWAPNARIVVTRNPHYWDAADNQLERVIFHPTDNVDVEERNFRAGQLHVTYNIPPAKIAGYRERTPAQVKADPMLDIRYLIFNTQRPPLDNAKVRRALALAIDRAAISQAVYFGAYQPAPSFVPTACGDYSSPASVTFDPMLARQLLAEAGFPEGRGFPVFSIQMTNSDQAPQMGEALQAQWKKELGLTVTLEPLEVKSKMQNLFAKNFAVTIGGWSADFADPISYLALLGSKSGNNYSGWSNAGYDALLNQAANSIDAATRMKLFQRAEELLLAEAPVTSVLLVRNNYLIHPAVRNWSPSPLNLPRYQFVRLEK